MYTLLVLLFILASTSLCLPLATFAPTGIWHIVLGCIVVFWHRVLPHYSDDIFILLHCSFLTVFHRQTVMKSDWSIEGSSIKNLGN